jgi:hypothetical protein
MFSRKFVILLAIFCVPSSLFAGVKVVSLLPNATGEPQTEYFELQNTGCDPINLAGYTVQDNSSAIFHIGDLTLYSQEVRRFLGTEFPFQLNNTGGDFLLVKDANGEQVDYYYYTKTVKDVPIVLDVPLENCPV